MNSPKPTLTKRYQTLKNAEWGLAHLSLVEEDPNSIVVQGLRQVLPKLVVVTADYMEVANQPFATFMIESHIKKSALDLTGTPLGYYLFRNGEIIAFDPCTPSSEEFNTGATLGVLMGLASALSGGKNPIKDGIDLTTGTWKTAAGLRTLNFFKEVVDTAKATNAGGDTFREQEKARVDQAFVDACDLLGIGPETSEKEAKKAFRRKQQEVHPDKGGTADKASAVNNAWDLYRSRRGWSR